MSTKTTSTTKRQINPEWKAEVASVLMEMTSEYRTDHGISDSTSDDAIRKMVKRGELPKYPVYTDSMKEASKRRCAKTRDADTKHKIYRKKVEAYQAKRKATKAEMKTTDISSTPESADTPEPAPVPTSTKKIIIRRPSCRVSVTLKPENNTETNTSAYGTQWHLHSI